MESTASAFGPVSFSFFYCLFLLQFFFKEKDIAEGDELLFDYGEDFFMEERNDIQK